MIIGFDHLAITYGTKSSQVTTCTTHACPKLSIPSMLVIARMCIQLNTYKFVKWLKFVYLKKCV